MEEKIEKNNKFKIIIFLVIIVLLIVLLAILLLRTKETEEKYISSLFTGDNLIRVSKENKYGYIDSRGKIIVEPIYDQATVFYGGYAIVRNSINDAQGNQVPSYKVIDSKGEEKITAKRSYDINYYDEFNVWVINHKLYDSNLNKISKDNVRVEYKTDGYLIFENDARRTAGIMDYRGKEIYTYRYTPVESYIALIVSRNHESLKDKYCVVNIENKKYSIVNCKSGKVIYDFTTKYISSEGNNIFQIRDEETNSVETTIFILDDKIVYDTSATIVRLVFNEGYIEIQENEKRSYYDLTTRKVVSEKPKVSVANKETKFEKETGLKQFTCESENGLQYFGITRNGKTLLPCEYAKLTFLDLEVYKYLRSINKRYVLGIKNNSTYLINLSDKKNIFEMNSIDVISGKTSFIYYKKDYNTRVIYNLITNKSLETSIDHEMHVYTNYITLYEDGKTNYYNSDFEKIYSE